MGILKKKCAYCGNKIDKGKEVFRDVKVPGFIGTRKTAFMSEEHADKYEDEVSKTSKKSGHGCC